MTLIDVNIEALLSEAGAKGRLHSGVTLYDHLVATYSLLLSWANPKVVCLAGLCHSVYSTEFYREQSLSIEQRGTLAALIGEEAERLVYLFSICGKSELLMRCPIRQPTRVWDPILERTVCVSPVCFSALIEITCANLVEQWGRLDTTVRQEIKRRDFHKWKHAQPHLSESGWATLNVLLTPCA